MSKMEKYDMKGEDGRAIATVIPVETRGMITPVLNARELNGDPGRSPWVWVRFANGALMLGVFPQGDAYFEAVAVPELRGLDLPTRTVRGQR